MEGTVEGKRVRGCQRYIYIDRHHQDMVRLQSGRMYKMLGAAAAGHSPKLT